MKAIASPLKQVKPRYEVVVIGSGYGGGVSASRMARAGRSVCLLERGKEILPPNFPNTLMGAKDQVQMNTPVGQMGPVTGLYDLKVNEDMNALVGCGLGGTSLINANVALEVDPRIFEQPGWPAVYKDGSLLKPYYDRARRMLGSTPYPRNDLNKLAALEAAAAVIGVKCYKPPINVTFENKINSFNVEQLACNNCGDCCSGCNVTAKNTTQMNYLPDAHNHGAEIFCEARVERLSRNADGTWNVHVTDVSVQPATEVSITADIVMVCAGTFGSTEILLRSRTADLTFSDRLGAGFSGNGDVLAFGYDNYWKMDDQTPPQPLPVYGVGVGANKVDSAAYPGPCIAGVIDNRDTVAVADGRVIEEGVIPGALAMAIPALYFFASSQYGSFLNYGMTQTADRLEDAQLLGNKLQSSPAGLGTQSYTGPTSRSQTYLVMSYDDSGGKLYLDDSQNVRVAWKDAGKSSCIINDNNALKEVNNAMQGQFVPNPMWSEPMGYKLITVHPLGGCCMGDTGAIGAVSPVCEVYDGSGTSVHKGLLVLDGSVLPTAAGVNPLLTISAISEYAVEQLALRRGWTIDYTLAAEQPLPLQVTAGKTPAAAAPDSVEGFLEGLLAKATEQAGHMAGIFGDIVTALKHEAFDAVKDLFEDLVREHPDFFSPGLSFSETMRGFVTNKLATGVNPLAAPVSDAYEVACAQGKADGTAILYNLTIATNDLQQFLQNHTAGITGEVICALLDAKPLKVSTGAFILFNPDPDVPETWTMQYQLHLESSAGPYYMAGTKYLHQKTGSHWWTDVTTLYVDIYKGKDATGQKFASGIMTLGINDAIKMAQTVLTPLQKFDDGIKHEFSEILDMLIKKYPQIETTLDTLFVAKFGGFCAETVFQSYGGLLADLENFPHAANQLAKASRRALKLPAPELTSLTLADGAKISLARYRRSKGAVRRQVILAPGFSVKACSFATATVDTNLAEFLFNGGTGSAADDTGYDVWLFAYRGSPDSGNEVTDYTIDDIANLDWPAAVAHVRQASGKDSVDVVAHCVGSMSLLMSLLKGLDGVNSVVSSQLTLHPVTDWMNFMKADLNVVGLMEQGLPASLPDMRTLIPLLPNTNAGDANAVKQSAAMDVICWEIPVPAGEECKNPVCHRVTAIFGPSYTHTQLNNETHNALEEWFDQIAVKPFEQLQAIIEKEYVVDAAGNNSYLPQVARLKLPITFIAGDQNQIFLPETSLRTYQWLLVHNGHGLYKRKVFPGYAHMDMFVGKNAAVDVFPFILERLNAPGVPLASPLAATPAA